MTLLKLNNGLTACSPRLSGNTHLAAIGSDWQQLAPAGSGGDRQSQPGTRRHQPGLSGGGWQFFGKCSLPGSPAQPR